MNMNLVTTGMTAQEREIYIAHQAENHEYEKIKIADERKANISYRQMLINDILAQGKNFTAEELSQKSLRTLERIYDC